MARSSLSKLLFALLCAAVFTPLVALDAIPFYIRWQSANRLYYDRLQSGKELSWDEIYRAEFGYEDHDYKGINSTLKLNTEQFFDTNTVHVDEIKIGYKLGEYEIFAGSRRHGYGTGFEMDSYPTLKHGFEGYQFKEMRLNSLGLKRGSYSIELGGNTHNQASLLMMASPQLRGQDAAFTLDIRSMDSHWRTPAITGSATLHSILPDNAATWDNALALSIIPGFGDTPANHELYLQSEIIYPIFERTGLTFGGAYIKREYAPKERHTAHLALSHRLSKWRITPQIEHHTADKQRQLKSRLNLDYLINPASHIGFYYEYSSINESSPRHQIGFALDLYYLLGEPFFFLPADHPGK